MNKFKIKKNVIFVKLKQNFYLILKIITVNIVNVYTYNICKNCKNIILTNIPKKKPICIKKISTIIKIKNIWKDK